MRPPSDRLRRDTITYRARQATAPGSRVAGAEYGDPVTVAAGVQPADAPDRDDDHMRLGSEAGWRVFVNSSDAAAVGFDPSAVSAGDLIQWRGIDHTAAGPAAPETRDATGTVLSWSIGVIAKS